MCGGDVSAIVTFDSCVLFVRGKYIPNTALPPLEPRTSPMGGPKTLRPALFNRLSDFQASYRRCTQQKPYYYVVIDVYGLLLSCSGRKSHSVPSATDFRRRLCGEKGICDVGHTKSASAQNVCAHEHLHHATAP